MKSFYYFDTNFLILTDNGTLYYYDYFSYLGPVLCENLPFVTEFFGISNKLAFLKCDNNEIWELQLVPQELQGFPLLIKPNRCFKVNYFEMIDNINKIFKIKIGNSNNAGKYIQYRLFFIIDNNEKLWCCNFTDKNNITFLNCDVFSQYEITYIIQGESNIYFYYRYGIFYVKQTELCPSDKPTKINLVFDKNHDYFVNKQSSQKSARK